MKPEGANRESCFAGHLFGPAARLCAALAMLIAATPAVTPAGGKSSFVEWRQLRNPVLGYPDWSVKDATVIHRDGVFYLFFSAFYEDRGRGRCHVAEVSTRDFKTYSAPLLNFAGDAALAFTGDRDYLLWKEV
jgi:hypothetical protein